MRSVEIVRLESGMTVEAALRRLGRRGSNAVALVHRREVGADAWYRLDGVWLEGVLGGAQPDAPLGSVVSLDALNRVPVTDLADTWEATLRGVVTIGSEVVGFVDEPVEPPDSQVPRRSTAVAERIAPADEWADVGSIEPGTVEQPPARSRDQSLTAHGAMEAPDVVSLDEEFTVSVRVEPDPAPGTPGSELFLRGLPDDVTQVAIDVHLVSGFEVIDGSGGSGTIEVDRASARGGPIHFKLKAASPPPWYDPQVGVWVDRVMALFAHQGVPCGQLWKEVKVNVAGDHTTEVAARHAETRAGASTIELSPGHHQDLTIVLSRNGGVATGEYTISLRSPHYLFPFDERIDLKDDSLGFAAKLISDVDRHLNDWVTDEALYGIGEMISERLPDELWNALRTVWDQVAGETVPVEQRRVPAVLLLTDDTYVPWELAVLPEPLDPGLPPFLGAQVNIGRWPLDVRRMPDPATLSTTALGVVVGHYQDARGVRPLPSAEEEGNELAARFQAQTVNATDELLSRALSGQLGNGFVFEGLHFAGHGVNDPEGRGAYLMLSNGRQLSDFVFRAPKITSSGRAFLFLNACQVGTATQTLGSYAGVAGLAVRAGFRGFIAPLWSVTDSLAKDISLGFYQASSAGETPAGYLRGIRGRFRETDTEPANATWLAYIYYGHPALRMDGPPVKKAT